MKRKTNAVMLSLAAVLLCLAAACSSGPAEKNSQNQENGISETIDRQTTRAAEKIERKIRTPLDRARETKKLGDRRLEDVDRALAGGN